MVIGKIQKEIKEAIVNLQKKKVFSDFEIPNVTIERPEEKLHGDYATNIALQLAKIFKKSPIEIANILATTLNEKKIRMFEKIETASPGFINFFLSKEYIQEEVSNILKLKNKFGRLKTGKGVRVQVEFLSCNPTGPLTVGNSRGGIIGDVLTNVLKSAGFKTQKAFYINDYGMQILTLGHSVLKDAEAQYTGEYIDYLNKINKEKDPFMAGESAAKIILNKMIKKTTDRMGIKYDEWFSEKTLHKSGAIDNILKDLRKKGLIYEKENAVWFKSSQYGDTRDRVVIKSNGQKTYLASDFAYHQHKFKKADKAINVWGADHYGDIPALLAGVQALGYKGKLEILLYQFVTLFEKGEQKKMSKRLGVYVTMDELLDEVGPDVIRFFFLQKSSNTHLNFDLDLAKQQSEQNPVYYIQYAYARICSILKKCKNPSLRQGSLLRRGFGGQVGGQAKYEILNHASEIELIKQLIRLPDIIESTSKDYQVQKLPQYAMDIAAAFHQFYRDCRVITEDKNISYARLSLISATKIVLKNTFELMGISSPEKM